MHNKWEMLHPKMNIDILGFIPSFLDERNMESARVQIDNNYQHGGGWQPTTGFKVNDDKSLSYPGDPDLKPLAKSKFRDETLYFYDYAWLMIEQKDGSHEIARLD